MKKIGFNEIVMVKESTKRYDLKRTIGGANDAWCVFNEVFHMDEEPQEILCGLYLNQKKEIIAVQKLTAGTLNASLAKSREVLRPAVWHKASYMYIAHNHPSGDPQPSCEDIAVTQRISEAGRFLDITLIDHLIIGEDSIVSLREQGYI